MPHLFVDREDAGKQLSKQLKPYAKQKNTLILALPRGGVPVAYPIATALKLPLDIFLVRKLGVPWQEELAMGAIASGNITVFNDDLIRQCDISQEQIDEVIAKEKGILEEREKKYLSGRKPLNMKNQTVILVDDGIATGATTRAAISAIQQLKPGKIILAVPVAPPSTIEFLRNLVDEVICLETPEPFSAIGYWYENFSQTEDKEVTDLLQKATEFLK